MKKTLSLFLAFLLALSLLCGCAETSRETPTPDTAKIQTEQKEEKTQMTETAEKESPPAQNEIKPVMKEEKAPEEASDDKQTVSLTVTCEDVLDKMDALPKEKHSLIPQNGIMYADSCVEIKEGESVFDILKRELIASGVHLEFSLTPVYNSAYIEGIGNLYEFDCGKRSGWKYSVNGKSPPVGCSDYKIKAGDSIVFIYKVEAY